MELILTHEHTDFDALASLVAAKKLFPEAEALLPRHLNRNLQAFLSLYGEAFPLEQAKTWPRRAVDRIVLVDAQSFQAPRGVKQTTPVLVIDHHAKNADLPAHWQYQGESVGANTTLLVEKIISQGLPVTPIEATLFLLGIYEDTGMLLYQSSTARDANAVAWLLAHEARLEIARRFLIHPLSTQQRILYDLLIQNSDIITMKGHTLLIATAEAPEMVDEISTLAHKMRNLFEPTALFLLVKIGDRIQLVARSSNDAVDVGEIARQMGGGGHPRAAAAVVDNSDLIQIKRQLIQKLRQEVQPAITVAQIMSAGVQTLNPTEKIAIAADRMRQYGFEGFPVVDEKGRLLGILTRRQVDRALHHGLGNSPVQLYMHAGHFTIRPDASVARLRRLIVTSGWGQIPVVDTNDHIIGIVTRTDLIKGWQTPMNGSRAAEITQRMEETLPPGLYALLQRIGQEAEKVDLSLYAVGGFVRDLLLGRSNFDVDLVVEQDAITLAEQLVRHYGGRIRRHHRFGTAKWILPAPEERGSDFPTGPGLPQTIDLVTARTEFYEHPTALPTVERSSIKLDLLRRDFTINTLAIRMDGKHWGELLDFFGGEADLQQGIIRVLHSLSFVEDPTRILRAVRFEQRFNFRMEAQTEALIKDAVGLLKRVTGARIRHELELILQEQAPELALRRLDQLHVLEILHPALCCDPWIQQRFQQLRLRLADQQPPEAIERLYFALLLFHQETSVARALVKRLLLRGKTKTLLQEVDRLKKQLPKLQSEPLPNSQIAALLRPFRPATLFVVEIAASEPVVSRRIDLYRRQLQQVKPYTDGHRLRELGVHPGPYLGHILATLRDAWLDGGIRSREEEEQLLQTLLAEPEHGRSTN